MTITVRLPVLRVEDVRSAGDVFRCDVLHASLSARSCVARQQLAVAEPVRWTPGTPQRLVDYASCRGCADGVMVSVSIGPIAPPAPVSRVRVRQPGRCSTCGEVGHRSTSCDAPPLNFG